MNRNSLLSSAMVMLFMFTVAVTFLTPSRDRADMLVEYVRDDVAAGGGTLLAIGQPKLTNLRGHERWVIWYRVTYASKITASYWIYEQNGVPEGYVSIPSGSELEHEVEDAYSRAP